MMMRLRVVYARSALLIAAGLLIALREAPAVRADDATPGAIACETLVELRVLTAGLTSSADAAPRLAAHPSCRLVSKADLGEVAQRAMIGGAPFECLTVSTSQKCMWVLP